MALEKVGVRAVVEGIGPYQQSAKKVQKSNQRMGKSAQKASKQSGGLAKALGKLKIVGPVALAAVGFAAIKFGSDFDRAFKTIRVGTGATGEALEGLKKDFKETLKEVPENMAEVAQATADLNTRLGLTGPPLQALTKQFLDLARITDTQVNTVIAAGTRVFGDWSIATEDQAGQLDFLFKTSQATGIGIDKLMQQIVTFGAPLRQMGFDFESAAVLTAKWEKEGVNAEAIFGALKIGVANFAKEGVPAAEGLQDFITEIQAMGPSAEATTRAIEVFGSRAGPDMVAAVLEGRFGIDEMRQSILAFDETIATASDDAKTWQDKLAELRNELLVRFEPALTGAVEKLEAFTTWILDKGLPMTERFVSQLRMKLRPAFQVLRDAAKFLRIAFEKLAPKVEVAFRVISKIIRFLNDHREIVAAVAIAIGVVLVPAIVAWTVATVANTVAHVALAAATLLAYAPILLLIAGIALLVLGIILLVKHWDTVTAFIKDTWRKSLDFIVAKTLGFRDWMLQQWARLGDNIQKIVKGIWEAISGIVKLHMGIIQNVIEIAMAVLRGDWRAAWEGVKDLLSDAWDSIQQIAKGAMSTLLGALQLLKTAIIEVFRAVPGLLLGLVTLYFNAAKSLGSAILDGLLTGLKAVPGVIGSLADQVLQAIKAVINIGIKAINDLIPDKIAIPFAPDINLPDNPIPKLQSGGIVPGPVGRPVLALMHGGERVTPAASAGGGQPIAVTVNAPVSMQDQMDWPSVRRAVHQEVDDALDQARSQALRSGMPLKSGIG